MVVPAKQPMLLRIVSQGAKGGFRAVEYRTVRLDEVEGVFQTHARHLGETHSDLWILEWKIVNPRASSVLPAQHPEAAKGAVAIINYEGFGWRGGYLDGRFHRAVIA